MGLCSQLVSEPLYQVKHKASEKKQKRSLIWLRSLCSYLWLRTHAEDLGTLIYWLEPMEMLRIMRFATLYIVNERKMSFTYMETFFNNSNLL